MFTFLGNISLHRQTVTPQYIGTGIHIPDLKNDDLIGRWETPGSIFGATLFLVQSFSVLLLQARGTIAIMLFTKEFSSK